MNISTVSASTGSEYSTKLSSDRITQLEKEKTKLEKGLN